MQFYGIYMYIYRYDINYSILSPSMTMCSVWRVLLEEYVREETLPPLQMTDIISGYWDNGVLKVGWDYGDIQVINTSVVLGTWFAWPLLYSNRSLKNKFGL
mgnify:CR=1 FL=1